MDYLYFGKAMAENAEEMSDKQVYTIEEVFEILRQVMFGGTPELYDQGGMHRNANLQADHTIKRAKEAFMKFYLNKK